MTASLIRILGRLIAGARSLTAALGTWLGAGEYHGRQRAAHAVGRAAGGAAAVWFVGGMLYAFGLLGWGTATLAVTSAWVAGHPNDGDDDAGANPEEPISPAAFLELVHDIARGGNVHLNAIREQLAEELPDHDWTGPAVTALCDEAGIPIRKGVRVPGATPPVTTGIHRDDIPPHPSPASESIPVDVVAAGQHANNNTNTTTSEVIGEGAAVIVRTGPSIRQEARR